MAELPYPACYCISGAFLSTVYLSAFISSFKGVLLEHCNGFLYLWCMQKYSSFDKLIRLSAPFVWNSWRLAFLLRRTDLFEIVFHLIVCHNSFVLGPVTQLSNAQVFYCIHLVCAMQALKEKDI